MTKQWARVMISHFTEEGTQTAPKYIQICSTPLVIRKTASLIQTRVWLHAHHFHKNWKGVAEWQKLSPAVPAVGDDQEKQKAYMLQETLHTVFLHEHGIS